MTSKLKSLFAALLLVASAPSMADSFNLGPIGVPSATIIGNSFWSPGTYVDNYSFSISQVAFAGGLILQLDPILNRLDIKVTGVSLSGSGGLIGMDTTASGFYFANLGVGSYTLSVFSSVTRQLGLYNAGVGYAGLLILGSVTQPVSVPEPGTLALFGLGLLGAAVAMRRRNGSRATI